MPSFCDKCPPFFNKYPRFYLSICNKCPPFATNALLLQQMPSFCNKCPLFSINALLFQQMPSFCNKCPPFYPHTLSILFIRSDTKRKLYYMLRVKKCVLFSSPNIPPPCLPLLSQVTVEGSCYEHSPLLCLSPCQGLTVRHVPVLHQHKDNIFLLQQLLLDILFLFSRVSVGANNQRRFVRSDFKKKFCCMSKTWTQPPSVQTVFSKQTHALPFSLSEAS